MEKLCPEINPFDSVGDVIVAANLCQICRQAGWSGLRLRILEGKPKVSGLRLVHRRNASPRGRGSYGCQYHPRDEFRKNRGIVEGLALDRFAGPDGLMLLLSMIAERELPAQELIELAKRVQIPGYEAVYELVHDAVSEGVIVPSISSGFYLQCEIWDVLKWAKYRTSLKASRCWASESVRRFSVRFRSISQFC